MTNIRFSLFGVLGRALLVAACCALGTGMGAGMTAGAPVFASAIDDLPIMEGLTEDRDFTLSFDAPDGRIVEIYTAGQVTREAVLRFYGETLPQLGWKASGPTRFLRDGEALHLKLTDLKQGVLTVRFSLAPIRNP